MILHELAQRCIGSNYNRHNMMVDVIKKEIWKLCNEEFYFDHSKIPLLCQEIVYLATHCPEVASHICHVLSYSEFDKDAEIRSAVILAKRLFQFRTITEHTCTCNLSSVENITYEILEDTN